MLPIVPVFAGSVSRGMLFNPARLAKLLLERRLCTVTLFSLATAFLAGCSRQATSAAPSPSGGSQEGAVLRELPLFLAKIDAGDVGFGEKWSREVRLTNRSNTPVDLARLVPSCDCLRIEFESGRIAPGEGKDLYLEIKNDPESGGGNLALSIAGYSPSGSLVFVSEIWVNLLEGAPAASCKMSPQHVVKGLEKDVHLSAISQPFHRVHYGLLASCFK